MLVLVIDRFENEEFDFEHEHEKNSLEIEKEWTLRSTPSRPLSWASP
jgi:hypothetical protein